MYEKVINDFKADNTKNKQVNHGLDPELDLRNINFATGENHYLNESSTHNDNIFSYDRR